MVIGLVLMAGIVSVFASSRRSFDLTQEISTVQESARFAMEALTNDIRLAGFQGCSLNNTNSATVQTPNAPSGNLYLSVTRGAEISGTTWTPPTPAELNDLNPEPVSDSDVLMIQYGSPTTSRLASPMVGIDDVLVLENNSTGLKTGDLAIISDCDAADLFMVSNINGNQVQHSPSKNYSGNFSKEYAPGATPATDTTRVMKFNYITYYVGDSGRVNTAGDSIRSLYAYDIDAIINNEPPTEIVEGVENMQVLYGVRTSNGTVRYVEADSSSFNAPLVNSIQIGLLMYSVEGASDQEDERTYRVLNTEIKPAGSSSVGPTHAKDKRIRMTFNSTVKVRNRREQ